MTIGITGGTGFIGQKLQQAFLSENKEVTVFSRHPELISNGRQWSQTNLPKIDGCDQLIHLAGESIVGLWTKEKKRRILESRLQGTRRVVEAIAAARVKPSLLLCASAIGYYGERGEHILNEESPPGRGFLAEVAQYWEEEALKAEAYGVRVVMVRIGIVLGREGGMIKQISPIFRLGLGGILGSGKQWMSCIHVKDLVGLILHCCHDRSIRGPINAVMPSPVINAVFTKTVGTFLKRPTPFKVPKIALRLMLGDLSNLLLSSQRVLPTKAIKHHYYFQYPTIEKALQEILVS